MAARSIGQSSRAKQLKPQSVNEIVTLLKSGDAATAEKKLRKLIKRNGEIDMLYDLLANAQLAQEKFSDATKSLSKLLELKPDHTDAEYNLALAYMQMGRTADAVTHFQSVGSKQPKNADAFNNLGAALFELERYGDAVEAYERALAIDPKYVPALRNIGAALRDMQRLEEAEKYLSRIPFLQPRYVPGHLSLGVTYRQMDQVEKAKECFATVLKLDPENREAHYELGNIFAREGHFDEAITEYGFVDSPETRVKILEIMHERGDPPETILKGVNALSSNEPQNLRAAAFSAFVAHEYQSADSHPFAPDPFQYVSMRDVAGKVEDPIEFLESLISASEDVNKVWENRTTRGGFQTHGNLFEEGPVFKRLETIVREEIAAYVAENASKTGGIIGDFPDRFDLDGWHVKLLRAGFQKPHIHTRGWVSGVLYLKVPNQIKGNEGGIAFSLHGFDYRKTRQVPVLEHQPKAGDMVLFPSSLFHHTIPFDSDEERHCIAFDVLPVRD